MDNYSNFSLVCMCLSVCMREKSWTEMSFLHSEQAEGCFSVTMLPVLFLHHLFLTSLNFSYHRQLSQSLIFLFSSHGFIPVATEAPVNEFSLSCSLCLSSSGCCAGTERWGSGKILSFSNACTICCKAWSIWLKAYMLRDRIHRPSWAGVLSFLVTSESTLQSESGSISVDFFLSPQML